MTSGTFRRSCGFRIQARNLVPGGLASSPINVSTGPQESVVYGTGGATGDLFVATTRVLAGGASATYDLFGGVDFVDLFDGPAAMRLVKTISVWVASGGDDGGVRIGGAGSNPWLANFADPGDMALIYPGGPDWSAGALAGLPVTSTSKNLKVENLGVEQANVRIVIAASTAVPGVPIGFGFLGGLLYTYP